MKSFKKLLSVLVMLAMLASFVPASIAASYSYEDQAVILNNLGIFKGTSATSFVPDLGGAVTREQGVIQLVRTLGKETAALAMTDIEADKILIVFSDAKTISSWSKKYIAWAVNNKIVAGYPNGKFGPQDALSGKAYAKLILSALGHTVDAAGYEAACFLMRDKGIVTWGPAPQGNLYSVLSFSEAQKFNDKEALIRDDLVALSYAALKLTYSNTASETVNIGGTTTNIGGQNYVVGGKNVVMTSMRNRSVIDVLINGKTVVDTGVTYTFDANKVNKDKAIAGFLYFRELKALAETAVAAYETAAITSLAAITAAEALKAAADTAVAEYVKGNVAGLAAIVNFNVKFNLNNAWIKADYDAFLARITARTTAIANAKAAEIAAQAAANTALDEYNAAPITTLADIAAAEALGVSAGTKINACVDAAFKTAKLALKATRDAQVAARKAVLSAQISAADAAIDAFKNAPAVTKAEMEAAFALSTSAEALVAAVEDPAAKATLLAKWQAIPGVFKVMSDSLAQVKILFSKPLPATIGTVAGNNLTEKIAFWREDYGFYEFGGGTYYRMANYARHYTTDLSADGRTVTVFFDGIINLQQSEIIKIYRGDEEIEVAGNEYGGAIVDVYGVPFKSTPVAGWDLLVKDTTPPAVASVELVSGTLNKIRFVTSEPLDVWDGITSTMTIIDTADNSSTIAAIVSITEEGGWNANSMIVQLLNPLANSKTYKIIVDWAYDFAGLMAPINTFMLTTPAAPAPDVTAPALVSIDTFGKDTVVLTFSENIASATAVTVKENGTDNVLLNAGTGVAGKSKAKIVLTAPFSDAAAHHGFLVSATVKDAAGNTLTLSNVLAATADDHTDPAVTAVTGKLISNVFAVDITLTETIKWYNANGSVTYEVAGSPAYAGTLVDPLPNVFDADGDGVFDAGDLGKSNVLTVKFLTVPLTGMTGIVKINVPNIAIPFIVDTSIMENPLAAYTSGSISAPDKVAPAWSGVIVNDITPEVGGVLGGYRLIEVTYPEDMDPATLGNFSNYKGVTDGWGFLVDLSTITGARIQITSPRSVVIQIPPYGYSGTINRIEIKNQKDKAGNAMSPVSNVLPITMADPLETGDFTAAFVNPTTVTLTITEGRTFGQIDYRHFTVTSHPYIDGIIWHSVPVTAASLSADKKTVTLTLGSPLPTEFVWCGAVPPCTGVMVHVTGNVSGSTLPGQTILDSKGRIINFPVVGSAQVGVDVPLSTAALLEAGDTVVTLVDSKTITVALKSTVTRTFYSISPAVITPNPTIASTTLSADKRTITIKTTNNIAADFVLSINGMDNLCRTVDLDWTFGTP